MDKIKLEYTVASRKVNNKIKKIEEIQTWINYENLLPADKINLRSKFGGVINQRSANKSIGYSTNNPEDKENPKTVTIINTLKYLESTGNYEIPSIDSILIDMVSASKDILTDKDKEEISKSTDELWLKFMQDIQNPEMQTLLKNIGQYSLADSTFGWQLASSNLIRIKAQRPDATFVQTRKQWYDRFKRRVKPNAKAIGVMVPRNQLDGGKMSKEDMMKLKGYSNDVKYNDLSVQQKNYIDVSLVAGQGKYFDLVAYYDVSDTELVDPNGQDIWAETVGFDNNLTGHLNNAALQFKASQTNTSPEEINKIYNNEKGDIVKLTKALAKGISEHYQDIPTMLPKSFNENAYLKCYSDMLYALSDKLIEEKGKIVKKENRTQGILIASTIVMCLTKVSPETVARQLANNKLTETSYFELRTVINTITSLIRHYLPKMETKHKLNEMEIPVLKSVDELLSIMGMNRNDIKSTPKEEEDDNNNINSLKENFFKIFNRINQK